MGSFAQAITSSQNGVAAAHLLYVSPSVLNPPARSMAFFTFKKKKQSNMEDRDDLPGLPLGRNGQLHPYRCPPHRIATITVRICHGNRKGRNSKPGGGGCREAVVSKPDAVGRSVTETPASQTVRRACPERREGTGFILQAGRFQRAVPAPSPDKNR